MLDKAVILHIFLFKEVLMVKWCKPDLGCSLKVSQGSQFF